MSSTNKTANLNMHSWVPTDPVVREDFNENFSKIDAAIGEMRATYGGCEIYVGQYTGVGERAFSLTFPKLPVYFMFNRDGYSSHYSAFVKEGTNITISSEYWYKISVSGTTITFTCNSTSTSPMNYTGILFHYIAFAPAKL